MTDEQNHAGDETLGHVAPTFAASNQPSYLRILFLGPDGLRAGWSLAFYFLLFFSLQRVTVDLAWMHDLGESGLWNMMLEEFGNLLSAVIPAVLLAWIEKRPFSLYGLPGRPTFGRNFWLGIVWGWVGISVLMLSLYGMHVFRFGHPLLHGVHLARFAGFWFAMFLLVGFFEEFWLRGYSQFTLARGIGFWPAAIALSCAFGLIHLRNGGEQWRGLVAAAAIGFFLCLTLRRTGTLWFAVGFHAAWDWGETFFYSVPDSGNVWPGHLFNSSLHGSDWLSGGSVGPEGSVFCLVVIAALWVVFGRIYPTATYCTERPRK
ncbi:MAG TPA: type II CAAX endopeptidase family protein [Candidatus Solibacter sp.]|nr:type II CAAX endopeptidase family protein [Candidatus Solibacter sp.]